MIIHFQLYLEAQLHKSSQVHSFYQKQQQLQFLVTLSPLLRRFGLDVELMFYSKMQEYH